MTAAAVPRGWRHDSRMAAWGLLALLLWDAVGVDPAMMRLFGGTGGFALRTHWLTADVLHDGGRWLSRGVLLALALNVAWPLPLLGDMPRAQRLRWCLASVACLLAVALLKHFSTLSCPWALIEFGGSAHPISHASLAAWRDGDGGPGHCFPAGHASNAFAFLVGALALRSRAPRAARFWLAGVWLVGAAFGLTQVLRGAHYPSHSLWTAWICGVVGALVWHAPAARAALVHTARHGRFDPSR